MISRRLKDNCSQSLSFFQVTVDTVGKKKSSIDDIDGSLARVSSTSCVNVSLDVLFYRLIWRGHIDRRASPT